MRPPASPHSVYDNSEAALGYSVFYYTQDMYVKDNVKLLAIDGVVPATQTISDGTYPYGTYYYAVLRHDEPADSTARQLVDWCLSGEGQQLAASVGYVPLDPADIVPIAQTYGYAGSTAENTTQSSGTGGPVGQALPDIPATGPDLTTDASGALTGLTLPGYPEAEAAIRAWAASLPAPGSRTVTATGCAPGNCTTYTLATDWRADYAPGLMSVSRTQNWTPWDLGMTTVSQDSAVFRLSDGHRLALADLFYTGVNYISFINGNLLDPDQNQALSDSGVMTFKPLLRPFTGLPATYDQFGLQNGRLEILLPADNPFLSTPDPVDPTVAVVTILPLNLPADLSPYGLYWRTTTVTLGTTQVQHLQRDYGGDNPIDAILNAGIDKLALEHQADSAPLSIGLGVNYDGIVNAGNFAADWNATFNYATGERLS